MGINCILPKICVSGSCLDCNSPQLACKSPQQICVKGLCEDDPCLGVDCPVGQYCDGGACKELCVPGKCGANERCIAGAPVLCVADPCSKVFCAPGQFCNPTTLKCETDRCPATQCGAGMACVPQTNTCIPDPCKTINCQPDDCWTCKVSTDGKGTCVVNNDKCKAVNVVVGQKGGGNAGCSCEVGGGGSYGPLGLLLGFAAFAARRRRRR
jgi:MYXO-CTERM domain-containing protein